MHRRDNVHSFRVLLFALVVGCSGGLNPTPDGAPAEDLWPSDQLGVEAHPLDRGPLDGQRFDVQSPDRSPSDGPGYERCIPQTCGATGRVCGAIEDGCGRQLDCGSCSAYRSCTPAGQCELELLPQATFWPLPASGTKDVFWWVFDWKYGDFPEPAGSPAACPDKAPRRVAISARYYTDGAYQDPSLLSINFFKDHGCTYWNPGRDLLLRWYSKGFQPSQTTIIDLDGPGNHSASFLSFRGDSRWKPDRTHDTALRDPTGALKHAINGRFAFSVNGQHPYDHGYSVGFADGDFPDYGVLPDRPLSADVIISRHNLAGAIDDVAVYCRYAPGQTGWNDQRFSPSQCTPYPPARWVVYFRKTTATFEGKSLLYAGHSETLDDDESVPGACEEWWYADQIGPVYVATFPALTFNECTKVLAATSVPDKVNDPLAYFQLRKAQLRGWMVLTDRCLLPGCQQSDEANP